VFLTIASSLQQLMEISDVINVDYDKKTGRKED
jgi:hypothetical protein